jgi:hypothetical protein
MPASIEGIKKEMVKTPSNNIKKIIDELLTR